MIEQIYNDFNTKLLPKLAQGFSITKDYFSDLFGRYVKYLIVTDSILVAVNVIMLTISPIIVYKTIKNLQAEDKKPYCDRSDATMAINIAFMIIFGCSFIISMIGIFPNTNDLIKDIYIPELRIYEEYRMFNQS